ncbi:MAG: T9SS type A sorting domain-containing protein [Bacteroidia bacterium]|nr:T9SS type A sorting domain-containing protein [Bacteroidia bacterium]
MNSTIVFRQETAGSDFALRSAIRPLVLFVIAIIVIPQFVQARGVVIKIEDIQARISHPDSSIVIAPNPVYDYVEITAGPLANISNLDIVNSSGALVFSASVNGTETFEADLAPGVYYFRIQTNFELVVEAVVISAEQ